ncbi:MAG TPA: hypothetical protein VGO50_15165 [Pyrinomonadaceae bacterium]|jgi:hypothetical protein|nr:hypothetical protein [Pyrinomonadaceae bacterium]
MKNLNLFLTWIKKDVRWMLGLALKPEVALSTARLPEDTLTSIQEVYKISWASYDITLKRLDAMDGRLATTMTLGIGLTLLILGINKDIWAKELPLVGLAFVPFVLAIAAGLGGRFGHELHILEPKNLIEHKCYNFEDDKFRLLILGQTAAAVEYNTRLVRWRHDYLILTTNLFLGHYLLLCLVLARTALQP